MMCLMVLSGEVKDGLSYSQRLSMHAYEPLEEGFQYHVGSGDIPFFKRDGWTKGYFTNM